MFKSKMKSLVQMQSHALIFSQYRNVVYPPFRFQIHPISFPSVQHHQHKDGEHDFNDTCFNA